MFEDLDNSSIKSLTIVKVNVWLRESNPDAYIPKMVSIGPYHKINPQLCPVEKYKILYLRRFLQRNESLDLKSCINEPQKLKEEALKCYDDIEDLNIDRQFCQMLLLDGCFVVEFIRKRCQMCLEGEDEIININVMVSASFRETECNVGNIKHLLHLVHIFSCHGNHVKLKYGIMFHKAVPNATKHSEARVSFAKVRNIRNDKSLFDIKFENGLMTIPCIRVEDDSETFLHNLIAYEQQSSDVQPKYFSDYVTFMDYLIDLAKYVNLLRRIRITVNWMGEDKYVATLFNKITYGVTTYSNFYYYEECLKACQHCEKSQNYTDYSSFDRSG
ncbi:hypothetical protein R3W88_011547 [Solanum pinnatisectum]|uniref:Uncharacterized protein n=1 Tax=Solanum pinnatisectum TaxID=50273 RepID=A0AAV9L6T8_9SOLN|nr:hypothetical protein R3W88_011547 [Solanum pinnatisectum]